MVDEPPPTLRSWSTQALEQLASPKVRRALATRSALRRSARVELEAQGFTEFDTPVIGPRVDEYEVGHVSANMPDGTIVWLAQSPQLYKQMLIQTGYERYFQFAHCFRDVAGDAARAECLIEFVQLDLEMETDDPEEVMVVFEGVLRAMFRSVDLEPPEGIPRLSAIDCLAEYGNDRPDLRNSADEQSLVWVVDFPLFDMNGQRLMRHPMAKTFESEGEMHTRSFDLVWNGFEIASGDLRIDDGVEQRRVLQAAGYDLSSFSELLTVLDSGIAPHGGIGMGLDRLVMQLCDLPAVLPGFGFGPAIHQFQSDQ